MNGKVKWFDAKKGYGFIIADDGNKLFVHHSGINIEGYRKLRPRQEVSFDVAESTNGHMAVNVTILK